MLERYLSATMAGPIGHVGKELFCEKKSESVVFPAFSSHSVKVNTLVFIAGIVGLNHFKTWIKA